MCPAQFNIKLLFSRACPKQPNKRWSSYGKLNGASDSVREINRCRPRARRKRLPLLTFSKKCTVFISRDWRFKRVQIVGLLSRRQFIFEFRFYFSILRKIREQRARLEVGFLKQQSALFQCGRSAKAKFTERHLAQDIIPFQPKAPCISCANCLINFIFAWLWRTQRLRSCSRRTNAKTILFF
jgi:hypothetical protein